MVISVDLSRLWLEVNKVSEKPVGFTLVSTSSFEEIDLKLEEGIEIDIDEVDFSGPVASYKGRQVLLYIADHGSQVEQVVAAPDKGNRFHVTDCVTLESMRRNSRFERYVVTNDLSGKFLIHGQNSWNLHRIEQRAELWVCKNCMNRLNYKGYKTDVRNKDEFVRKFNIPEFFETYSSLFRTMPKAFTATEAGTYTDNWAEVSTKIRASKNYTCDECKVCLVEAKALCHVHHINGVKSDNTPSNLRVLCADCHRRQPQHGRIHISHADMQLINRLRRQHQQTNRGWEEALRLADPAIFGALSHLRRAGYPPPEIGFELQDEHQRVIVELEAAWPSRRYALVVSEAQIPKIGISGWNIVTLADYHEDHL